MDSACGLALRMPGTGLGGPPVAGYLGGWLLSASKRLRGVCFVRVM